MNTLARREFLVDVGRGMLIGGVGLTAALELGFVDSAFADEEPTRLAFGSLDPLVDLMQETPPDALLARSVSALAAGTDLKTLVAAAALANARRFGGEDYVGYHTFMALAPAYAMAQRLPDTTAPLPVLKVIHRNAQRIQEDGGPRPDHLHVVAPGLLEAGMSEGEQLRRDVRMKDRYAAERTLAALATAPIGEAFNHLQFAVQDEIDVHRIVLPWRAWSTIHLVGPEHATTLLRQSVRFCVADEVYKANHGMAPSPLRNLLTKLLDENRLTNRQPGSRVLDDATLLTLAQQVYGGTPEQSATAVAAALADDLDPESVGEAISLAACWLVLHDPGRETAEPGKPVGSVHGACVGVHASDSANAWRNVARVTNPRNRFASLIAGAYHTAGQTRRMNEHAWPLDKHMRPIITTDPDVLLRDLDAAIRDNNQVRACALAGRYQDQQHAPQPMFDLLLQFACSEDGQLHAEKYFLTALEEYGSTRPSLRNAHLCALARVTASEFGTRSAGYELGRELLKV